MKLRPTCMKVYLATGLMEFLREIFSCALLPCVNSWYPKNVTVDYLFTGSVVK